MLKFFVHDQSDADTSFMLRNAHLLGADNIGVRGEIEYDGQFINVEKRSSSAVALALQFPAGELGELTLQTCLLPDRDEPYVLSLELARHRLMLLLSKQEDWMLFELESDHKAVKRGAEARSLFVRALNAASPAEADALARKALSAALDASEELALTHAELLLNRRKVTGQFHRGVFGCGVGPAQSSEKLRATLAAGFDYIFLPTRWKCIEPQEQTFNWSVLDGWAEWAYRSRIPILAGPLISFDARNSPDWLGVLEHDYETLRDILYEHVERTVTRYRNVVTLWNVVSGIHVNTQLNLTLEQVMDLTRMAVLLTKKIQPNAKILVELTHPFGEYYADNARSIPPFIYADMILQAGVPVDAFGVRLLMGRAADGQYTRDMMQISALLDRFNALGKPVHMTGVAVPSAPVAFEQEQLDEVPGNGNGHSPGCPSYPPDGNSGHWRKEWSPAVQAHWLEAFYSIALSKPFVDSVSWLDVADHDESDLPHSGLTNADGKPKTALARLTALRKTIHAEVANARRHEQ